MSIGIIPLQWIRRDNAKLSQLYQFFKDHDLQGSILQEAIFDALWRFEQPKIIGYVFIPYMIYFIVCQVYFFECMLHDVNRPISLFVGFCEPDEYDCFGKAFEPTLRYLFITLLAHQIAIEIYQAYNELPDDFFNLKTISNFTPQAIFSTGHFKDLQNIIDFFSLFANFLVIWLV